jgi:hypothetical protein
MAKATKKEDKAKDDTTDEEPARAGSMFDVRLIEHRLRAGAVTADAYGDFLDELPDEAEEGVESDVRFATPFADRRR